MKIAVACTDMSSQNTGRQPWYYMNSIMRGLSARGHDVWILTDKDTEWQDSVKTLVLENLRSFPRGIDVRASESIEKQNFDVIIWSTGLTDFFYRKKIDILQLPVISVITSPRYSLKELLSFGRNLFRNEKSTKQFLLGPLISLDKIEKFLGISNLKAVIFECKDTLRRYVYKDVDDIKCYVIAPPLPEEFVNILKNTDIDKGTQKTKYFKILYFGPPIEARGIDTLINALYILNTRVSNVRLRILSRIEYPELLRYERKMYDLIRKRNLSSKIDVISGVLKPRKIVEEILASNVVCLPFKYVISDVPIAVLETLLTGIPLITTEIAGVREFAKNGNCTVVPPRNEKALANAIIDVLENDLKRTKGRFEDGFAEKYNLKNFASTFENVIKNVV